MAQLVNSTVRVSTVRDTLEKLISTNFASTLGRETDIINIVNALVHRESKFNVNAVSPTNSSRPNTGGARFLQSSAIAACLRVATSIEKDNIYKGLNAVGLMQVLGSYFMRGGSPTGVAELERLRPELAEPLLINPGEDIFAVILGEANIKKALTAGLIILESKYRACMPTSGGFTIRGDPYGRIFPTRILGAVSAYLGLGASDGYTTPEAYANSIIGGDSYRLANGKNPIKISDSTVNVVSFNGPVTNGLSKSLISIAGCNKTPATPKQT